jgi:5,10-methylenetetrahydromethanopterin reductase
VIPEEEQFVTPELIDRTCMVGTPEQLRTRVAQLYAAGLDQLVILPPIEEKEAVIADIARVFLTERN